MNALTSSVTVRFGPPRSTAATTVPTPMMWLKSGSRVVVDTLHARGTEWMFDRQYVATTNAARRRWIMNVFELRRKVILCTTAAALCLVGVVNAIPLAAQDQDDEVQIGQEVFNELKDKGEIIESSPLYDQLRPIADAITRAAQPRYNHPLKFYLVHENRPNAFATPGGNVYVVDSLLYFVKNTDELAGTLCHEVSHTIHHDAVELMKKREALAERGLGAAVLFGHPLAIAILGALRSQGYSRDVESR